VDFSGNDSSKKINRKRYNMEDINKDTAGKKDETESCADLEQQEGTESSRIIARIQEEILDGVQGGAGLNLGFLRSDVKSVRPRSQRSMGSDASSKCDTGGCSTYPPRCHD
jgi:hypothetical protein